MNRMALVLAMLLLAPTASAAPWLQFGYDAARSGATVDPGPGSADLAFSVHLDGARSVAPFVIVGREVFIPRADPQEPANSAVHVVDLDTARESTHVSVQDVVDQIASDGRQLFVTTSEHVAAYPLAGGDPSWITPFPNAAPDGLGSGFRCIEPAVADGALYLSCDQFSTVGPAEGWPIVMALNASTGRIDWHWSTRDETPSPACAEACPNGLSSRGGQSTSHVPWMAIVDDTLVVVGTEAGTRWARNTEVATGSRTPVGVHPVAWGLDRANGDVRWILDDGFRPVGRFDAADIEGEAARQTIECGSHLTGGAGHAFVRLGTTLYMVSAGTGHVVWTTSLDERKSSTDMACGGTAMAYSGGRLFVTSFSTLYRIDPATRVVEWHRTFDSAGDNFVGGYGMAVAGGTIYVSSNNGVVSAVNADDPSEGWRRPMEAGGGDNRHYLGVGEGVLVLAGEKGDISVFGRTGASIVPVVRIASSYPQPGDGVAVDLSASLAGAQGPAIEFRADWGDGTVTEWQSSPAMEHVYHSFGPIVATFSARNAAGQEASEQVLIDVGGTPPQELNFMQAAFAPEHLDMTWGVIGVAVVLLGALVAGWRRRRHHSVLADEMRQLREIRAQAVDDPVAAGRHLDAYDARIVGDLDARRLTDAQYSLLRLEVQGVRRTIGKRAMAPVAPRLPPPLRASLESALQDGRITTVEAAALRDSLGSHRRLSQAVRREVMALIDAWQEVPG